MLFAKMNGSQKGVDNAVDLGSIGRTGNVMPGNVQGGDGNPGGPVFISEGAFLPEGDMVDMGFDFAQGEEDDELILDGGGEGLGEGSLYEE